MFAVFVLCLWSAPVKATLITIEIEGVVDSVRDTGNYLEGKIKTGDIITGFYTYESTTPDSSPLDPVVGHYYHYNPPAGISLTVGGLNFKTDPANINFLVGVGNDGPSDIYWLVSYNNLALSNGTSVYSISWQLNDPTGSVFSSDALPTTAPVLDDWQSGNLLRLYGERAGYIIDAHVTSAIPEPAIILMLGFGSLLLRKRT
jgi:hypothetical protein